MKVHIEIHGQNVAVEVSVEVGEYLDRADHKTENLFHEQRRHWDGREFDEYIVAHECNRSYYGTPEDWLCRKETLREIIAALESCTEIQRQRSFLYALDGFSCTQIGNVCGCSKYAVPTDESHAHGYSSRGENPQNRRRACQIGKSQRSAGIRPIARGDDRSSPPSTPIPAIPYSISFTKQIAVRAGTGQR